MKEKFKRINWKQLPFCTIIIAVANLVIFLFQGQLWNGIDVSTIGVSYESVMECHEFYRLFSAMFTHSGETHLVMNLFSLCIAGYVVESRLGALRTFLIYLFSGLGGAFCSMLLHQWLQPGVTVYSVGASGAIFGLIVGCGIIQARTTRSNLSQVIIAGLLYVVMSVGAGIDAYAHAGGAITGGLITALMTVDDGYLKREKLPARLAGIVLTCGLVVLAVWGKPICAYLGLENEAIGQVRQSFVKEMDGYSDTLSYEELFSEELTEISWEYFHSTEGKKVVEVTGNLKEEPKLKLRMQFVWLPEGDKYEPQYLEIGTASYPVEMLRPLLTR